MLSVIIIQYVNRNYYVWKRCKWCFNKVVYTIYSRYIFGDCNMCLYADGSGRYISSNFLHTKIIILERDKKNPKIMG